MDYTDALAPIRAPLDGLLREVAQLWRTLGLPSEVAAERVTEICTQFEAVAKPILESERAVVEKAQQELSVAREGALAMATEVGEDLRVPETMPLLDQIEELQKERVRLEPFRERRAEELRELTVRIARECQWMGVELSQYSVPDDQTGAAGVRTAKQRLGRLEALQEARVTEAAKARTRIQGMAEELGGSLEFRVAHEGELTGSDDGVVVLERTAENEAFVREVTEFEDATRREVIASGRFEAHLRRLEEQYQAEVRAHREGRSNKQDCERSAASSGASSCGSSDSASVRSEAPAGGAPPGARSRSPLVWRQRPRGGHGRGRGEAPHRHRGPRGPRGPRRRTSERRPGRPPRWSQSRSPMDAGRPPHGEPRRRRDDGGGWPAERRST